MTPRRRPGIQDQLISLAKSGLETRGWTQAELARRLKMSPKHVNQMLTGRAPGRLVTWDRVFKTLRLRVEVMNRDV